MGLETVPYSSMLVLSYLLSLCWLSRVLPGRVGFLSLIKTDPFFFFFFFPLGLSMSSSVLSMFSFILTLRAHQ